MKSFSVNKVILKKFYRAVIESVLTFSITVWYSGTTQKDRAKLNRIVKTASKIIGDELQSLFKTRAITKSNSIIRDVNHPAHTLFDLLPSGTRYRSIRTKTNRFKNSFYPTAVRLLNELQCYFWCLFYFVHVSFVVCLWSELCRSTPNSIVFFFLIHMAIKFIITLLLLHY